MSNEPVRQFTRALLAQVDAIVDCALRPETGLNKTERASIEASLREATDRLEHDRQLEASLGVSIDLAIAKWNSKKPNHPVCEEDCTDGGAA
jgi:hypothetical protein